MEEMLKRKREQLEEKKEKEQEEIFKINKKTPRSSGRENRQVIR